MKQSIQSIIVNDIIRKTYTIYKVANKCTVNAWLVFARDVKDMLSSQKIWLIGATINLVKQSYTSPPVDL